jgi:hypothetical protein
VGKKVALLSLAVMVGTGCSSTSGTVSGSGNATAAIEAGSTLSCRLPVISPALPGVPPGGWITFPGGQFDRDPASLPSRLQSHVPSYDWASKRWLPVESRYVAPDGGSYILTADQSLPDAGAFYFFDVKTGTRRLLLGGQGPSEAPGSWTVVDYASAGVYLWSAGIQTVPGLWLLDPATGKVRLIDGSHYWRMVAGGVAWALDPQGPGPGVKQAVYRLDLASGRVERWYETGSAISMLSPDSDGHVLVVVGDDSAPRLGLLVGPDQFQSVALPLDFPLLADGYLQHPGVWLSLRLGGLALYTEADGVRIMTRNTEIFDVAGGCW